YSQFLGSGVPAVDLVRLALQVLFAQAPRVARRGAVVREAEVGRAPRDRGLRHLDERGAPVAVGRVAMEDAADVAYRDELRERLRLRGLDFAPVLAQLRLDVLEAEHPREVRLGADRRVALSGQLVLVQAHASIERAAADSDVVGHA